MARRLAADSCVIVKWFKKGEEFEKEALRLRDDVLLGRITLVISEWTLLEVARGLRKAGYPKEKVDESFSLLRELADLDLLKVAPVSRYLVLAKDLISALDLYASDAIHLALALMESLDLLSEDKHLLRGDVREYGEKRGVRILRLKEEYSQSKQSLVK